MTCDKDGWINHSWPTLTEIFSLSSRRLVNILGHANDLCHVNFITNEAMKKHSIHKYHNYDQCYWWRWFNNV